MAPVWDARHEDIHRRRAHRVRRRPVAGVVYSQLSVDHLRFFLPQVRFTNTLHPTPYTPHPTPYRALQLRQRAHDIHLRLVSR